MKSRLKKVLITLFFFLALTILIAWLNLGYAMEKIIFQPKKLAANYTYQFEQDCAELNLTPEKDVLINALYFKAKTSKGLILYFHGNRDNLARWGAIASQLTQYGYDVFVMDYRGYGKSYGIRTEENLYKDALYCYNFILKQYKPNQIILYGRSLGTGIASWLSAQVQPTKLILETPYYSMSDLVKQYYTLSEIDHKLTYKIPSFNYLKNADFPILILHGTADEVVPYTSGEKLYQTLPEGQKTFIRFERGQHNNLKDFKEYWEAVGSFLN